MRKKLTAAILVFFMMVGILPALPVQAETTVYSGSNVNAQNYSRWTNPIDSYLEECEDGALMRVQYVSGISSVIVEYYDSDYELLSTQAIPQELPIFGGFYATDTNYYLVTGQTNPEESADVEVYRITKYDKNWNRLGSAGLYDCNTTVPFDAGSVRMDSWGKYLLIRTSHEMYMSSDGYNHQANVTIQVDTDTMKITDSYTGVMNNSYGYISHSFNQFIKIENGKIVAVDHGDAYPRSFVLSQYPTDVSSGSFYSSRVVCTDILEFPGGIGVNATGATAGGFELSDTSYLVAGNSVVQDDSNLSRSTRNIFLAAVDKETKGVTINWLTDFAEGETTTRTPQLVKIADDRFMVIWSRGSDAFYTECNGSGQQTSAVYCMSNAAISDCVPIVKDNTIIWYTWDDEEIIFYEIGLDNIVTPKATVLKNGTASTKYFCGDGKHNIISKSYLEPTCTTDGHIAHWGCAVCGTPYMDEAGTKPYTMVQVLLPAGHTYENQGTTDGVAHLVCQVCGDETDKTVFTSIVPYWNDNGGSSYSTGIVRQRTVGDKLYTWIITSPSSTDDELEILISDKMVMSYTETSSEMGYFTALKAGTVTVTIRSKYNTSLARTYTFTVSCGDNHIWNDTMSYDETGHWYNCSGCTETKDYAVHSGGTATGTQKAICETCGQEYGEYAGEEKIPVSEIFTDVSAGDWYEGAVQYVYDEGIMGGMNAAYFGVSENLQRSQFASVLYRMTNEPPVEYEAAFSDVAEDAWYAKTVIWAYKAGVVNGYKDGRFGPDDEITREQIAVMMYNYAKAQGYAVNQSAELDGFADADQVSDWAKPAVQWAVGSGVISGKNNGTLLDPQGNTTRAECAAIIQRFMNLSE